MKRTADAGFGPQPYFAIEFIAGQTLLAIAPLAGLEDRQTAGTHGEDDDPARVDATSKVIESCDRYLCREAFAKENYLSPHCDDRLLLCRRLQCRQICSEPVRLAGLALA